MKTIVCFLLVALIGIGSSQAQEGPENVSLDAMSLENILNTELTVASKIKSTVRETPGIVTLLTHDEIRDMGCRSFLDVMRLVPGFQFASDVVDVVGFGVRGNWVNEGKVLLLVDDVPFNSFLFGDIPLNNRIPMDLVDRIEVIRGPGSVKYGGFAEVAVINVKLRTNPTVNSFMMSELSGTNIDSRAKRSSAAIGNLLLGSWQLSGSYHISNSNRFSRDYLANDGIVMSGNQMFDHTELASLTVRNGSFTREKLI